VDATQSTTANLSVRVHPRAGRNEISGERDGRLLIRVTAPPVDGRANAAVCRLIAKAAGIPKGRVSVTSGESHRDKVVTVEDLTEPELRSALGL
jgi:uncharacterized protein (TIGR00251 family)